MSDRPEEMDERDVDERFASIIADWDTAGAASPTTSDDTVAEAPPTDSAAATSSADDASPEPAAEPTASPRPAGVNPSLFDMGTSSTWRVPAPRSAPEGSATPAAADRDDEHYDPPAVQLPPQEDLHFWGAVLGLVAGPLCLVYVAMARPFHSTRWFLAGLALSLLGFGLLILRQPRDRDHGDDGARV